MKKLEAVENPILRETAKELRKKKMAGDQENILKDPLKDMTFNRMGCKKL